MAMKASANGLNLAPTPSCCLEAQSRRVSVTGRSLGTSFLNGGGIMIDFDFFAVYPFFSCCDREFFIFWIEL